MIKQAVPASIHPGTAHISGTMVGWLAHHAIHNVLHTHTTPSSALAVTNMLLIFPHLVLISEHWNLLWKTCQSTHTFQPSECTVHHAHLKLMLLPTATLAHDLAQTASRPRSQQTINLCRGPGPPCVFHSLLGTLDVTELSLGFARCRLSTITFWSTQAGRTVQPSLVIPQPAQKLKATCKAAASIHKQ